MGKYFKNYQILARANGLTFKFILKEILHKTLIGEMWCDIPG
jgi:hypothetical protein